MKFDDFKVRVVTKTNINLPKRFKNRPQKNDRKIIEKSAKHGPKIDQKSIKIDPKINEKITRKLGCPKNDKNRALESPGTEKLASTERRRGGDAAATSHGAAQ